MKNENYLVFLNILIFLYILYKHLLYNKNRVVFKNIIEKHHKYS